MKLKVPIERLQQGGNVSGTGMVFGHTYSPLDTGGSRGTTSAKDPSQTTKDSKKGNSIIDNDMIKQLVGKGITSDVNVSMQGIVQLQTQYDQLEDVDKNSQEGMMLLNRIQLQSTQVNHLLRNAEQFKEQQTRVVSNNALNEIAVTDRGVIIQHKQSGKIIAISPEQLTSASEEDLQQYKLLTNAELINEREYNQALQFDNTTFQQLNNSTGFINIKKEIKEVLATVNASSEKQTYDSYTDPSGKLQQGLQQLKNLSTTPIDNIISTVSDETNNPQLMLALEAIWSTLGDNSKTFLKQRALLQGQTPENIDNLAKSFIVQLVGPKAYTKTDREVLTDLGAQAKSGSTRSGEGSEDEDKVKIGYWDHVQNDTQEPENMLLQPYGGSFAIEVPTRVYGQMRNQNGTIYYNQQLGQIPELARMAVQDAGSFGGEDIISKELQMGIIYNGDPLFRRTLPYKLHPDTRTPIPDYAMIEHYQAQMEEIDAIVKSGKTLSISQKQNIFKSHGLNDLDVNGNPRNVADFFQVQVYMGEKIYKDLDKSSQQFLKEIESDAAKIIMDKTFASNKTDKKLYGNVWDSGDDVYKGVVYLPARVDAGIITGAIEDKEISFGDYKNRKAKYQTTTGKINRAIVTPHNMDMLNSLYNDQ